MHWTRSFRPLGPVWTPLFRTAQRCARVARLIGRAAEKFGGYSEPKPNYLDIILYTQRKAPLLLANTQEIGSIFAVHRTHNQDTKLTYYT